MQCRIAAAEAVETETVIIFQNQESHACVLNKAAHRPHV